MATYTPHLRLTDNMDIYNLDMTACNPTVSISGSNPLIVIEPPAPGPAAKAIDNFNAVVVNLGMSTPRMNITFTETGKNALGVGTAGTAEAGFGSDPFNLSAIYTRSQMLMYLYQSEKDKKKLYMNNISTTGFVYVHIASFRITNVAGQKDIMNFSIDLILVGLASQ
jgi:hypothetical protein